jgi:hypothetical protein
MPARKGTKTYRTPFHLRIGNFHEWLGKNPDSAITVVDIAKGKAPEIHMSIRWSFLTMRVDPVAFSRKVKSQPMRNRKPKSKSFDESELRTISVGPHACSNRLLTEK